MTLISTIVSVAVVSGLFSLNSPAIGQPSDKELIDKIPSNDGFDFRCEDMVRVVNHLRHLGKAKALEILDEYVKESPPGGPDSVVLICKVLFTDTNQWKGLNITFGAPHPAANRTTVSKFPLFPIAISGGIPFELVEGYSLGGFNGNPAAKCVEYCKNLPIISTDLTNTNYEAAAQALIQSKEFRELYPDPSDQAWIAFMIRRQAGNPDERVELPSGSRRIVPFDNKK